MRMYKELPVYNNLLFAIFNCFYMYTLYCIFYYIFLISFSQNVRMCNDNMNVP